MNREVHVRFCEGPGGQFPGATQQRPLGVTALEDKIVQRSTVAGLSAIYETDFLGFSYGFRK